MFDFIPIVNDWHWTLVAIWTPALFLPVFAGLFLTTEGWHKRRFDRQNKQEWAAGRNGTYEVPEHPAETAMIFDFLYLITVAPILSLVSIFLTGVLDWPLSGLPLVAQIYLTALAITLLIAIIFLSYDNEEGALPFIFMLLIGTPTLAITLLATGEWGLPAWAYILLAIVFVPPMLLWIIVSLTGRPVSYSNARENIEGLIVVYLMVSIPVGIVAALYIGTGTLLSLLALPILFLIAAVAGGGSSGSGGSFFDLPFSITRS